MDELNEIHMFDTVFRFAERYLSDIDNIRTYGTLDKNNFCSDALYNLDDAIEYINGSFTRDWYLQKFEVSYEIVSKKVAGIEKKYILLTKYGLIRMILLSGYNSTRSMTVFKEFTYALFSMVDYDSSYTDSVYSAFRTNMEIEDIHIDFESNADDGETGGILYFIKNTTTENIKIGRTDDSIETHYDILQECSDCELVVIKTMACDSRYIKNQLHEMFEEFHIRGDWFNITESQINDIEWC
jgi:hypothetical protein